MIHFQPNCTIPPEPPAFVTAPNVRSTMNIVWSCVSTILLCCWSIQHLNVPPQFQPKTTRQRLLRKLFLLWRKVKWMMMALFAPEVLLAKAVTDLRSCLLNSPMLKKLADEDGVPWSKAHTFLADMGGFALRFTPPGHSMEGQTPSAPSVDGDVELRISPRGGSSNIAREGQRDIGGTEEVQDETGGQGSGGSLPNQSLPRNPRNQESLPNTEAYDTAQITNKSQPPPKKLAPSVQDTITQRELVDEPRVGIDLPRLLSATEQYNRQALTSEEPAQQRFQPVKRMLSTIESRKKRDCGNRRRRFRARVENASQHFGDIMWRALRHNEIISTEVYFGSSWRVREDIGQNDVSSDLLAFEGDVWVLTAAQLITARKKKLIARLPHFTEDELSDRNKGDLLDKLLALLQVSWMVIQVIARATLHISSTPLEIMTLSFATCAFITFILLLDHPQDVTTSIYI